MIAWLAARNPRSCLPFADARADRRWARVSPCILAGHLPACGPLLTLATAASGAPVAAAGLLVARAELTALQTVRWLVVGSRVDADGPHEWIECRDGAGRLGLQCHLLPDTDYLGWEALTRLVEPAAARGAAPLRDAPPGYLAVLDFRCRRHAGLHLVEARDVADLSPWGAETVRAVARASGLALSRPTAPATR